MAGAATHTLAELAQAAGARLHGDPEVRVSGFAPLQEAGPGQVTFLDNPRYRKFLPQARAAAVILRPEELEACPTAALVTDHPYLAWARVLRLFEPPFEPPSGVQPGAHVDPSARLEAGVSVAPGAVIGPECELEAGVVIGPNCTLGAGVRIGAGSRLVANVVVMDRVRIGRRCLIHPGAVLGADGFGLARDGRRWEKVPQLGSVVIEDEVEIGANTTVDRGAIHDTRIRRGAKLDNQIQVAHNVEIGENTAIAACTGISGSTRIGADCTLAGGVGLVGHIELADGVHVTGFSMVTHSLREPGVYSSGLAAVPHRQWKRTLPRLKQLDEMARKLRKLEQELARLRERQSET